MSAAENKAVFLSYASQDAEAARRICDSLRSGGVEVWFDADGGLEHGDEWDQKIRRQIKECVLFIPVISANTQAREEGYFRLEWDLAAERARTIASGVPFILPVVIDDTREPDALVPDRFRAVQWTRLRGGEVPPDVQQRFLKLWSHRTGLLKSQAAQGTAAEIRSVPPAAETVRKPGAKSYAVIAAAIAVMLVGLGWWLLGRRSQPAAPPSAPIAATAPVKSGPASAPKISEARQLADRAYALADALGFRAAVLAISGQRAEAAALRKRVPELLAALVAQDPANREWKFAWLSARVKEAVLALAAGDVPAAETAIRESRPALEQMAADKNADRFTKAVLAIAWRVEAQLDEAAGRPATAAPRAVALGKALLDSKQAIEADLGEYATACVVAGVIAQRHGDHAEAARMWKDAVEVTKSRSPTSNHWRLLDPTARALFFLGQVAEARSMIERLQRFGFIPLEPWPEQLAISDSASTTKK